MPDCVLRAPCRNVSWLLEDQSLRGAAALRHAAILFMLDIVSNATRPLSPATHHNFLRIATKHFCVHSAHCFLQRVACTITWIGKVRACTTNASIAPCAARRRASFGRLRPPARRHAAANLLPVSWRPWQAHQSVRPVSRYRSTIPRSRGTTRRRRNWPCSCSASALPNRSARGHCSLE